VALLVYTFLCRIAAVDVFCLSMRVRVEQIIVNVEMSRAEMGLACDEAVLGCCASLDDLLCAQILRARCALGTCLMLPISQVERIESPIRTSRSYPPWSSKD
jgi:hypothetical protein